MDNKEGILVKTQLNTASFFGIDKTLILMRQSKYYVSFL